MIRRISKTQDLKDTVKSCPIDVIDSIHTLKYYVEGHEDKAIVPAFEKKGNVLVAVLPSQELKFQPNGVLYRKAYYSVEYESYPDHTYDLEIVDCLDVWLGDEKVTPSSDTYLTPDDLKTINGETIVGEGDIVITGSLTPEQEELINQIPNKADKSEIPSLEGYATEEWVEDKGYLTEHQQLKTINGESVIGEGNIEIKGGEGGLTPEQEELINQIPNKADRSEIPSLEGYATEQWVEGKGYLTEHQDISNLATKDELNEVEGKIPSLTGYATEEYVQEIDGARKQWVIDQGYLTEHQSLEGYATETWVGQQGYVTWDGAHAWFASKNELGNYALKTEIPTIPSYVSAFINDKGYLTEHQDISNLATKSELSEVEGKIPSLTGYATESWVEGKGYLTEHQDISNLATKDELSVVEGKIPSLTGYATEEWVEGKGYLTEHQDISNLATKSELSVVEGKIPSLTGYATEEYVQEIDGARKQWVLDQGYLTEHQSLDDCLKISKVNDGYNLTVNTAGQLKAKANFTPSSTNDNLNVASLGTVRNFYNDTVHKTDVWTGTQAQWDALTDTQKSSYTIALITE